jgi:hypothetical protein
MLWFLYTLCGIIKEHKVIQYKKALLEYTKLTANQFKQIVELASELSILKSNRAAVKLIY